MVYNMGCACSNSCIRRPGSCCNLSLFDWEGAICALAARSCRALETVPFDTLSVGMHMAV